MSSDYELSDDDNEYYDGMDMDDDDVDAQDDGKHPCSPYMCVPLRQSDSAISEDEMDIEMPRDGDNSSSKRKACEVEFDTLPQEAVEALIRKDVDHISSIFGVSVSYTCCYDFIRLYLIQSARVVERCRVPSITIYELEQGAFD